MPGDTKALGRRRERQRRGEPSEYDYDDALPRHYWDPSARAEHVVSMGLDGAVVFPNYGLLWERPLSEDLAALTANMSAWNRWCASVVADGDGRLSPVAHLTLRDPAWLDAQLAELARAGVRLAMIAPSLVDGRPLSHPDHDRLWSAFVEHGVTPVFHVADQPRVIDDAWCTDPSDQFVSVLDSVFLWTPPAVAVADLIVNGVLDRHDDLRIGIIELSAVWVPLFLLMLDGAWDFTAQLNGRRLADLSLRPSEYFTRQVRVAAFSYEQPARLAAKSFDLYMACSDYPHSEGTADPLAGYRGAGCDPDATRVSSTATSRCCWHTECVAMATKAHNAFPPIADYGFLSDCETTALVAPSGSVEWLCIPRVDSPSVFGSILDRDAGWFRLGPADLHVPAARRYLPGTMVLETSWGTPTGWIIVRDVLLIGPWHHDGKELSHTHKRAPTDYDADHVLLRTVRCVNGEVQVELDCAPRFDYGARPAKWEYADAGYHQGIARAPGVDVELRLTTDLRLGFEGDRAMARTLLKEGDQRFCALSWSAHEPPSTFEEAYRRLVWTAHHWQHWLARGRFPDHPWRHYLERSALTLKGLTYAPTGALVAAATTSLPETPGGERNWDYRYTWIRDSTFALWGLFSLGFDWEANDFFWFIADVAERDDELQIMYGVGGERDLEERDARPPERLRRRRSRAGRQRRLQAAPARRVGLVLYSIDIHTRTQRPRRRPHLGDPRSARSRPP